MMGRTMTEGAPWKHIILFTVPLFIGLLLQQLYNTVDTLILGNFAGSAGYDALPAVGTTESLISLFLALAVGFSAGNGVIVAQHYGAGNEKQVRANASTGILLMMGMGVLSAIAGFVLSAPAFTYLVAVDKSLLDLTLQYFRIYSIGFIFQYGYNIFSSILRAVGDSAATLYFLLIASIINIVLDIVFIACFHWGVAGAAIATDIAQAASFFAAYFYMTRKYPIFRFKFKEYTWDIRLAKKTLMTGFPIAFQQIIISMGFTFIQRAANEFGKAMTASYTVGQKIELYMNLPCSAFQTTLATYTGQNIGAGKINRVKKGANQTIFMSFLMTLFISVVVWFTAENIVALFNLTDQAAGYCISHLRATSLIKVIFASYFPLFGVFQGSNHGKFSPVVSIGAFGTRNFVTYLFRYSSFFGYTIIWWNGLFGFGAAFLISWSYYLSNRWQNRASIVIN